jgi:hypothetical protein
VRNIKEIERKKAAREAGWRLLRGKGSGGKSWIHRRKLHRQGRKLYRRRGILPSNQS